MHKNRNLDKLNSSAWAMKRVWQSTAVFLPGDSHGQRSLAGYSPWGRRVRHDGATKHSTAWAINT